jgi:ArsR family transcriptional regulator, arsenate/arsenite/antimonite-responsive transcriptional repressor
MSKTKTKKECPECLCSIGEKARIRIIELLKEKPLNVSKIAECFCLKQPTITHHLRTLEKMGILVAKKVGRETYYSLNKKYPCKNCQILKIPFKS